MAKLKDLNEKFSKHWLEYEIDVYDEEEEDDSSVDETKFFRASSAHLCPRALWYIQMGYKREPPSIQSKRRMKVGTLFHEFIREKLRGRGLVVDEEGRVEMDDPPLVGHFDNIIRRPGENEQYLLEIKSFADPPPNVRLTLPRSDHVIQWNLYAFLTKLVHGMLFYINKNNQTYYIEEQTLNHSIVDPVLEKLRMVRAAVLEGQRIPYQPNEKHEWCSVRYECEKDWFIRGQ